MTQNLEATGNGTASGAAGDVTLPASLAGEDVWSDEALAATGIPVREAPMVLVGGGIGTFVTADYLRIAGVPAGDIAVLSTAAYPWYRYEYLTRVSGMPRSERIRSDSASRPDNIWAFPSYALSEALRHRSLAPLWQVMREPVFADFYTPLLGDVLTGMQREARRIGYDDMLVLGEVRVVRRRADGGYFTVFVPAPGTSTDQLVAFRSRDVHLALGYPGLRFLPDLQHYRTTYRDYVHVVNAYEDHEHVYEALRHRPGTVLVRGAGIVASRILDKLITDRNQYRLGTTIIHLFRSYIDGPHGAHPWSRRRGGHGWAYQGFNYPKSVWGGQEKARMRRREGDRRARAYHAISGTTTAYRRRWQQQLAEGRREGWYRTIPGTVRDLCPASTQRLLVDVETDQGALQVNADFLIDCTGLNPDIRDHPVLSDLLAHTGAGLNPLGRLEVETTFEVRGSASGTGRLYASGAATLGGYFPGVDTFLGLQIAAQEITDDLARRGHANRIGPWRSTIEWLKWATNRPI